MSVHCRLHSTRALELMLTRSPRVDSPRLHRGTIGLLSTTVGKLFSGLLVTGRQLPAYSERGDIDLVIAPHTKQPNNADRIRLQYYTNCLSSTLSNRRTAISILYVSTELSTALRRISTRAVYFVTERTAHTGSGARQRSFTPKDVVTILHSSGLSGGLR